MGAATPAPSVGSMRCATPHQVACKSVTWHCIRLRRKSDSSTPAPASSGTPLRMDHLDAQRRTRLSTMRQHRRCHAKNLCGDIGWLSCCSIRSVCSELQSDLWLQHSAVLILDDALYSLLATVCHCETLKASGWLCFLHSHRLSTYLQASPPASRHEEAMHTFCT